jgi:hypothetical protein
MEPWLIGVVLRPFAALVLFGLIALPIRMVLYKFLPDGWLKRLLLRPIGKSTPGAYTWKEGRDFPARHVGP